MFLRIFQHLLPDGRAWRTTVEKRLRQFFEGLAAGAPADARAFIDGVYLELWPQNTTSLEKWEAQFALVSSGSDEERRARLEAAWQATGGQSPSYLQSILQAAGFDLYVHEWWSSGPPYVARDPRSYTDQPLIGTTQCGNADSICGRATAVCNRWLVNDPHYLVNENLTPKAPPPIPSDPAYWPYFIYIGAETFGDIATVSASRRFELEELLLRLCPQHQWIVLLIDFGGGMPSGVTWTLLEDDGTDWTLLDDPGTPWTTL